MADANPRPERPRRWRQFQLRTLLLLMTAISIALAAVGIPVADSYREQQIVAVIEASGGQVSRRFVSRFGSSVFSRILGSRPYMRVDSVVCPGAAAAEAVPRLHKLSHLRVLTLEGNCPLTESQLERIAEIQSLESLDIHGATLSEASLEYLHTHPRLSRLNVAQTPVSDEALEELEATLPESPNLLRQRAVDELNALHSVIEPSDDPLASNFAEVRVSEAQPEDLRHLLRLPGVTRLSLTQPTLTGKSVSYLAQLTDLRVLNVAYGDPPYNMLERLAPLRRLESLALDNTTVDDEVLSAVGAFSELTELSLEGTKVTGLSLTRFASLPRLTELNLARVRPIYDADLKELYTAQSLRHLDISSARVTPAGLMGLREALPNLRVDAPPPHRRPVVLRHVGDEHRMEAESAFWSGNYQELIRLLEQGKDPDDWECLLWLGHARGFAGEWSDAVADYQESLDLLADAIRRSTDVGDRQRMIPRWPTYVLLTGRVQMDLLDDPHAAINTLQRGAEFMPAAQLGTKELAAVAARQIVDLPSQYTQRRGGGQLWNALMYPLRVERQLALAYERVGDTAAALECWVRMRLCQLAYRVAMADTEPTHLARLWASMTGEPHLSAVPVFSVFTEDGQAVTLRPETGLTRLTSTNASSWDSFALVPKPGSAIASLSFNCEASSSEGRRLVCWAGDGQQLAIAPIVSAVDDQTDEIDVQVPFDSDVLFVRVNSLDSITIKATLRRREQPPTLSEVQPRRFLPKDVLLANDSFRRLDEEAREPVHQRMSATALARLADGRFLFARGDGEIELRLSEDGVRWDDPIPFPYNEIFPTRNPTLCAADDGTVWMAYLSKRTDYDIFGSAPYYVYLSSTRTGREWSRPKPVWLWQGLQYQETPLLTRDPGGEFVLIVGNQWTRAASPSIFPPMQPIYVPVHGDWTARDVHAAYDKQGRCHIVYCGSTGQIYYSYADQDGLWRLNRRLSGVMGRNAETPQLLVKGERCALLYVQAGRLWLHRGSMGADGPQLGPGQQIADHRIDTRGARLFQDDEGIYLALPADPPLILKADPEKLP